MEGMPPLQEKEMEEQVRLVSDNAEWAKRVWRVWVSVCVCNGVVQSIRWKEVSKCR